mmetsp:Transcript_64504/g.192166  ORF Transcript_64504/g.192166 Transcript_64504/m.192166 type:complete len:208 (+) Transcript_64504:63-686(+)
MSSGAIDAVEFQLRCDVLRSLIVAGHTVVAERGGLLFRGSAATWHQRRGRWRRGLDHCPGRAPVAEHELGVRPLPDEVAHRGKGHLWVHQAIVAEDLDTALIWGCRPSGLDPRAGREPPPRAGGLRGRARQLGGAAVDADPAGQAVGHAAGLVLAAAEPKGPSRSTPDRGRTAVCVGRPLAAAAAVPPRGARASGAADVTCFGVASV